MIAALVPYFVSQLTWSELSTDPDDQLTFDDIIEVLKRARFRIAEEVDSGEISAFVRSVESSKL
jgi:hypothetical protein